MSGHIEMDLFDRYAAIDALELRPHTEWRGVSNLSLQADLGTMEVGREVDTATDSLQVFLNRSRQSRRLGWYEELELAKRVERGDLSAKDSLVASNLPLGVSIAKHYRDQGLPFLDLIQEGVMGLQRAVEKFDYRLGCRVSTYATLLVREAIARALVEKGRLIRVPHRIVEKRRLIARTERFLTVALLRAPSRREIAAELGLELKELDAVMSATAPVDSLDAPVGRNEATLGDFVVDDCADGAETDLEATGRRSALDDVLKYLTGREQRVLALRYGLEDGNPRTLAAVGKELCVTRERIRQIEDSALEKLRGLPQAQALRDFVSS